MLTVRKKRLTLLSHLKCCLLMYFLCLLIWHKIITGEGKEERRTSMLF